MAWTDGDLKLFAAGLSVGGAWNSAGNFKPAFEPLLWNDAGQYDHFYIGFLKGVRDFSFGQFFSSVRVFGVNGPIAVTGVQKTGPATALVRANIAGQEHGVLVVGSDQGWLVYQTGGKVPAFAGTFYVAGLDSYADVAYCYDRAELPGIWLSYVDRCALDFPGTRTYDVRETLQFQLLFRTEDRVQVSYYKVEA